MTRQEHFPPFVNGLTPDPGFRPVDHVRQHHVIFKREHGRPISVVREFPHGETGARSAEIMRAILDRNNPPLPAIFGGHEVGFLDEGERYYLKSGMPMIHEHPDTHNNLVLKLIACIKFKLNSNHHK